MENFQALGEILAKSFSRPKGVNTGQNRKGKIFRRLVKNTKPQRRIIWIEKDNP